MVAFRIQGDNYIINSNWARQICSEIDLTLVEIYNATLRLWLMDMMHQIKVD